MTAPYFHNGAIKTLTDAVRFYVRRDTHPEEWYPTDANGVVRWIGTLPKDLAGKHTITLQGSVNVGQEITIAKAGEVKEKTTTVAAETSAPMAQAAAAGETSGVPAWAWWTGALALLVIAGAGTALVVAQRRKVDAPTHL